LSGGGTRGGSTRADVGAQVSYENVGDGIGGTAEAEYGFTAIVLWVADVVCARGRLWETVRAIYGFGASAVGPAGRTYVSGG